MANFDLSKLMEGKNPSAIMLEQTRGLKNKWEKTGLLEGINEKSQQHGMAVLLENQAKQLLDEATQTGTSAGSEEWNGVALPLVRRIFGEIAAKEFVSVQPMNLPSGLIFYMDFKYGSAQSGNPAFNGKSLYGGNSNAKLGSTNVAEGGLYGGGRYGYSVNQQDTIVSFASATKVTSLVDIDFDANLSASVADGKIFKVTLSSASVASLAADVNGVKSFYVSGALQGGTSGSINTYYPNLTTYSSNGTVSFIVSGSVIASGSTAATVGLVYSKQPTAISRGDFEDRDPIVGGDSPDGTNLNIPQVDLELKSEPIVAKTRKLKAVWTPELAQDLNAYHSIDAEAELTSMLSEYISLEIDLEILDMLKANALTTEYWSLKIGNEWNGSSFDLDSDVAAASAYTRNTWFQTLGTKINKVSNKIHQLTMRGGANFLVASPDVCTILESIPAFSVSADKDAKQFAAGVTQVGSIANRYTVYKNPYMTENVILMGYKGNNFLETGAVYAPYVPLILTPLVYDPDNFTPRRGVMTRYAKKLVRPEFFGRIVVGDLNLL